MKQYKLDGSLLELQHLLFSNKNICCKNIPLEALVYMLILSKKKCVILTEKGVCERAASVLDDYKNVAILFQENFNSVLNVPSFFENKHLVSKQKLSSNLNAVDLCFVEKDVFEKPILSSNKCVPVEVSCLDSYESLLKKLKKFNYQPKTDSNYNGCYIRRGGLIDVFPFSSNKQYRVSFLDKEPRLFIVNRTTNYIIKEIKSFYLNMYDKKKQLSLNQVVSDVFNIFNFKNNDLYTMNYFQEKALVYPGKTVSHNMFLNKYKNKKFNLIDSFFELGFTYNSTLYIPRWFIQSDQTKNNQQQQVEIEHLNVGDIYIHEDFGYCQYLGLYENKKEERVVLKFKDGTVRLNVLHIGKLSYFSNDVVELSFLNKKGVWKRKKDAAQLKAKEYVVGLINAYTKRNQSLTQPYMINDDYINTFVEAFQHTDTDDQAVVWKDIKKDLLSTKPMNRLVCGDVGFGKTEIAIRAAFAAVYNKDQVVVLAPTTILANQLFHCFHARLRPFGVIVDSWSRTTKKHSSLDNFINKKTDVLICTHAILSQKKVLGACGLFIIDEEHRFGVKDKELVFKQKPNVNFLSMSATPIPRSLQLSLSGIRNLSLIQTPPKLRKPIINTVSYFDINLIKTAILKELSRGGQVYFVDNSVDKLKRFKKNLSAFLPNIKIDIIYGTLNSVQLLKTMNLFINKKIDVLLSTTIIESGIDIGSTNTIIINNAHLFGLSQLYQLKGRVGRSSLQAFSWLLVPKKDVVTNNAKKRLSAFLHFNSLGSGYKIAQSDLEIRGSGSLFGYKQSGSGGVGFEFYTKLLQNAVNIIEKDQPFKPTSVLIYTKPIPSTFINNASERAYYYKKIFSSVSIKELNFIKNSIKKTYGTLCVEVEELIKNKELAFFGSSSKIKTISKKNNFIIIAFHLNVSPKYASNVLSFIDLFFTSKKIVFSYIKSSKNLIFQYKTSNKDDYILLLDFIKKFNSNLWLQ